MKSIFGIVGVLLGLIILWIVFYGCIYTSIIIFTIANMLGLDPKYSSAHVEGSEAYCSHSHAWVEISKYKLFQNPTKSYGKAYHHYNTKDFIASCPNMWKLNLKYYFWE